MSMDLWYMYLSVRCVYVCLAGVCIFGYVVCVFANRLYNCITVCSTCIFICFYIKAVCVHIRMCMYIYQIPVCMYACGWCVCMYVCMSACICICMCVCVCLFIHENPIFTLFEGELMKYNKMNIVNKSFINK